MPEEEISREDWEHFFDRLSLMRNGWYVTVEEMPTSELEANPILWEAEEQVSAGETRLQDIVVNTEEEEPSIVIDAGELPDGFRHVISKPVRVEYQESDDHNAGEITIDGEDGLTTIIYLRNPILSEVVKGDFEAEIRKDNPDADEVNRSA